MALHPADAVLTPVGPGRELDWKLVARRCQRNGGAAALIVPPKIYLSAGSGLSNRHQPEHSKPPSTRNAQHPRLLRTARPYLMTAAVSIARPVVF